MNDLDQLRAQVKRAEQRAGDDKPRRLILPASLVNVINMHAPELGDDVASQVVVSGAESLRSLFGYELVWSYDATEPRLE